MLLMSMAPCPSQLLSKRAALIINVRMSSDLDLTRTAAAAFMGMAIRPGQKLGCRFTPT
jgi:hypothetical protein